FDNYWPTIRSRSKGVATFEIRCPGCGRALQLGEQHAGKQVRCPACQQICVAPQSGNQPDAGAIDQPQSTQPSGDSKWYLRPKEGPTYGPISWNNMEQWAQESRISPECELGESAAGPWRAATEFFPALRPAPQPVTVASSPAANSWADDA